MPLDNIWQLLHLFFAFSFVGSLVLSDWNGRAARATSDWGQRVLLLDILHLSSRTAGLGSLVLLGVFGNLLSVRLGYRMASDDWIRWVNALWLLALLVMAFVSLPALSAARQQAKQSLAGGEAPAFDRLMRRWRLGNALLSLLYLALLILMVFRWRS
ncbi:MAG TPA: hypothetical protein VEY91_02895 [Candidatus Limnocylindria bacterium]|nr:hypothetical protein [Candidatus Limnocylindria bacterium]